MPQPCAQRIQARTRAATHTHRPTHTRARIHAYTHTHVHKSSEYRTPSLLYPLSCHLISSHTAGLGWSWSRKGNPVPPSFPSPPNPPSVCVWGGGTIVPAAAQRPRAHRTLQQLSRCVATRGRGYLDAIGASALWRLRDERRHTQSAKSPRRGCRVGFEGGGRRGERLFSAGRHLLPPCSRCTGLLWAHRRDKHRFCRIPPRPCQRLC